MIKLKSLLKEIEYPLAVKKTYIHMKEWKVGKVN